MVSSELNAEVSTAAMLAMNALQRRAWRLRLLRVFRVVMFGNLWVMFV